MPYLSSSHERCRSVVCPLGHPETLTALRPCLCLRQDGSENDRPAVGIVSETILGRCLIRLGGLP